MKKYHVGDKFKLNKEHTFNLYKMPKNTKCEIVEENIIWNPYIFKVKVQGIENYGFSFIKMSEIDIGNLETA